MESQDYMQLYNFLKQYPFEVSIEEGFTFFDTDKELISLFPRGDRVEVGYQTFDSELAKTTLRGGPGVINEWYEKLETSRSICAYNPVLKEMDTYVPLPSFESNLSLEEAVEACSYLAAKMIANAREENVLN